MPPFIRSGFLRLVRPASNAVRRTGSTSPMPASGTITNVSGTVSFTVRPQSRSLSTTQVLNQAATAGTLAEQQPPMSTPSTGQINSSEASETATTAWGRPSADIMIDYNARKATSVLSLADYEAFLSELATARDFNSAYSVYSDMRAAGITPSSSAYGSVLRAGRRTLRSHELRQVLGKGEREEDSRRHESADEQERRPTINFDRMMEIRRQMDEDGVKLNTEFWDDCAQWLAYTNNAGMLIHFAMTQELAGTTPSINYYNRMLYTLPRCGFRDRADMLFSRMVLNGMVDESTYTTRLGSLVYQGRFDEAESLFDELKAKFAPTVISYNTIIHGYLSAQQADKALEVLEEMKKSKTAQPNSVTASTFITSFYESGKLEHANAILKYFKESINYPQDAMARSILLKFYGRYDPSQASRLLQELVQAEPNFDILVYNSVLSILGDRRVHPDWKRLLGDIVVDDKPMPVRAGGLAELCGSLPFHIRHLVMRMEAYGVKPDASTYELVMRALNARKDFTSCIKLYEQMMPKEMYSSHHNLYLTALIYSGASEETVNKFLVDMRLRRWPISSANHRRIVEQGFKLPPGAFVYKQDRAGGNAAASTNAE